MMEEGREELDCECERECESGCESVTATVAVLEERGHLYNVMSYCISAGVIMERKEKGKKALHPREQDKVIT